MQQFLSLAAAQSSGRLPASPPARLLSLAWPRRTSVKSISWLSGSSFVFRFLLIDIVFTRSTGKHRQLGAGVYCCTKTVRSQRMASSPSSSSSSSSVAALWARIAKSSKRRQRRGGGLTRLPAGSKEKQRSRRGGAGCSPARSPRAAQRHWHGDAMHCCWVDPSRHWQPCCPSHGEAQQALT